MEAYVIVIIVLAAVLQPIFLCVYVFHFHLLFTRCIFCLFICLFCCVFCCVSLGGFTAALGRERNDLRLFINSLNDGEVETEEKERKENDFVNEDIGVSRLSSSNLVKLSDDILLEILLYLSQEDIYEITICSKKFQSLLESTYVYNVLLERVGSDFEIADGDDRKRIKSELNTKDLWDEKMSRNVYSLGSNKKELRYFCEDLENYVGGDDEKTILRERIGFCCSKSFVSKGIKQWEVKIRDYNEMKRDNVVFGYKGYVGIVDPDCIEEARENGDSDVSTILKHGFFLSLQDKKVFHSDKKYYLKLMHQKNVVGTTIKFIESVLKEDFFEPNIRSVRFRVNMETKEAQLSTNSANYGVMFKFLPPKICFVVVFVDVNIAYVIN